MTALSFFIQVITGTTFYVLDVYTDIKFSLEMYGNSRRIFGAELTKCLFKFDQIFDLAIEDCKMHFNKQACKTALAEAMKANDQCFENEQRFTDNTDWRIAGAVCAAHCLLPFLASFILWELIQFGQEYNWGSWTKLPIAFLTKLRKFMLERKLYETHAWADRNKDEKTQEKYEADKKKCLYKIEAHENIVVLSLVVESSVEASFQVRSLHDLYHV